MRVPALLCAPCLTLIFLTSLGAASKTDYDEFKIKRKQVFEFASKPRLTRTGDKIEIAFKR